VIGRLILPISEKRSGAMHIKKKHNTEKRDHRRFTRKSLIRKNYGEEELHYNSLVIGITGILRVY